MRTVDGLQVVEMVYQRLCAHYDGTDEEGKCNQDTRLVNPYKRAPTD